MESVHLLFVASELHHSLCVFEWSVSRPALQKDPTRVLLPSEVPGLAAAGYSEPTAAANGAAGGGKGAALDAVGVGGAAAAAAASSKQQQEEKQRRSLKNQIAALLSLLDRHPSSWPFRRPVSVSEAPDYYEVVKHPVDISSMRRKNKSVSRLSPRTH